MKVNYLNRFFYSSSAGSAEYRLWTDVFRLFLRVRVYWLGQHQGYEYGVERFPLWNLIGRQKNITLSIFDRG